MSCIELTFQEIERIKVLKTIVPGSDNNKAAFGMCKFGIPIGANLRAICSLLL